MAVLGATSLTGCNSIPDFIGAGNVALFFNTAAPTSWTKVTTHDNKALRVVSGNGGGSGGSTAFTSVFASRTPTGSVSMSNGAVTLSEGQLASHTHSIYASGGTSAGFNNVFRNDSAKEGPYGAGTFITFTGSSQSHTHSNTASFTGSALDFDVQYVDLIICSKN